MEMQLRCLMNRQGSLAEVFPFFDPATTQYADQITKQRRILGEQEREKLRNQWFWTADGAVYRVKEGEAVLYLTRGAENPIFNNIGEATNQLIKTGNYNVPAEDLDATISSESTLKVKLSDLEMLWIGDTYRFFEIDTTNYGESLNDAQLAFAERVYGRGEDFDRSMEMLRDNNVRKIEKTRIYVLNQDYVKEHTDEDRAIARACTLSNFGDAPLFSAADWGVDVSNVHLRGVPINADWTPKGMLAYLESNTVTDERFAAGLLRAANEFYQGKIKEE